MYAHVCMHVCMYVAYGVYGVYGVYGACVVRVWCVRVCARACACMLFVLCILGMVCMVCSMP